MFSSKLIICAGTTISPDCARIIECASLGHEDNRIRYVSSDWLSKEDFANALVLWVVDDSTPREAIQSAFDNAVPLLVPEANRSLQALCESTGGGLWYRTSDEAQACIQFLLENPPMRLALGEDARHYATRLALFATTA